MKFLNGYWLLRNGVSRVLHADYIEEKIGEDCLSLFASAKKIENRGDTVNMPILSTVISAVTDDVLRIDVFHHKGKKENGPVFSPEQTLACKAVVNAESIVAGNLKAEISSGTLSFSYNGKYLTSREASLSGFYIKDEKPYMVEYLRSSVGETFYGLGERFSAFVKNGQSVEIWNEDGGTASEQAYKNLPFIMSSNGYGILVASYGKVSFEICSEAVEDLQFSIGGEHLTYYVFSGTTMTDILKRYVSLTGLPVLPPEWSFGLWLSTSFTTEYDENNVITFIDKMEEKGIPLSVFHFDCFWMRKFHWSNFIWDQDKFSDPKKLMKKIHDRGIRVCVWINPYISQQSELFDECMDKGFLLKRKDGSIWQWDMWQTGMGIVDFTNPDATEWYLSQLRILLDMGVDCFKTDFGERIPVDDVVWSNGADPMCMHNYYSLLYNKMVFNLLQEVKGANEAVVFSRSSTIGGQKYPVHWSGDCSASYISMAETLRGGLSLALCGFCFWSHDIGGFEETATPDLYKRWVAFGMFSSHSRLHGSKTYRFPWLFDNESSEVLAFFVKLKLSLMPYIMEAAQAAHKVGIPIMRPMVLEFPEDEGVRYLDRQYMFGPSILVAPVMNPDGICSYYLPKGVWYPLLGGKAIEGNGWRKERFDYFSLPLFVKEGAVIPRKDDKGKILLHVYGDTPKFLLEKKEAFKYIFHYADGTEKEVLIRRE